MSKFVEAGRVPDAFAALEQAAGAGSSEATELLKAAKGGSPFSQALAFKLLAAAEQDVADGVPEPDRLATILDRDFAAACRVIVRPDFSEGVRAVLIDKDMAARWQPAALAEVAEAEIEAASAPLSAEARALGLQR